MNVLEDLRRHRKSDDTPYAIGGTAGVLAFLILAVFALSVGDKYFLQSGTLAAVVSATLEDLANSDRSTNAVAPLTVSPLLTAVAQAKANDMATNGYFAHTSPTGKDPWYWYQLEGYSFLYAGENLAVNFDDSVSVNEAWMNSPEHRANLLDSHFTQIGIATAEGTYEGQATTFVVEEFGTPALVPSAPVRTVTEPAAPTEPALATTEPASATPPAIAGAATTAPSAPPVAAAPVAIAPAPSGGLLARALASPLTMLHYAYYLLGLIVLGLLAYATRFEFKRHHLRHVVAASSLLALMIVLLVLANVVFFTQPVLAAGL